MAQIKIGDTTYKHWKSTIDDVTEHPRWCELEIMVRESEGLRERAEKLRELINNECEIYWKNKSKQSEKT